MAPDTETDSCIVCQLPVVISMDTNNFENERERRQRHRERHTHRDRERAIAVYQSESAWLAM